MAQQMAHYDIFRHYLAKQFPAYGHALWEPDPGNLYPAVEVGDVGYICQGKFRRLFNVLLPADHPTHRNFGTPEYHEQLTLNIEYHVEESRLSPHNFYSANVTVVTPESNRQANEPRIEGEVTFSCPMNQGAVLCLPIQAQGKDTVASADFGKWIIRNIDRWFVWARQLGLGINWMEDIVLVTGTHRTKSWTNVAFPGGQEDAQASFKVEVGTRDDTVTLNWHFPHERNRGAVLNCGPEGEGLQEDQCIFIRGFRATRRFKIFPRKTKGAAEPNPDPKRHDEEPDPELMPIPAVPEYWDPLHVLLQYTAEEAPNCDIVLVHDDSLARLHEIHDSILLDGPQSDAMLSYIRSLKPKVHNARIDLPSAHDSTSADTSTESALVATLSDIFEKRTSPTTVSESLQSLHVETPLPREGRSRSASYDPSPRPAPSESNVPGNVDDFRGFMTNYSTYTASQLFGPQPPPSPPPRFLVPPLRYSSGGLAIATPLEPISPQPQLLPDTWHHARYIPSQQHQVVYPQQVPPPQFPFPQPNTTTSTIQRLGPFAQPEMGYVNYNIRHPAALPHAPAYPPSYGFATSGRPDISNAQYPPGPSYEFYAPERTNPQGPSRLSAWPSTPQAQPPLPAYNPSRGHAQPYTPRVSQKKALFVGINYTTHPDLRFRLKRTVHDAYEMASFLQERCGFHKDNIRILTDDQHDNLPTKANILASMSWLVEGAQRDDSLFFYFSGHATQVKDMDGDEPDGFDDCLCTMEYKGDRRLLPSPDTPGIIVDDQIHDIMVKPLQKGCRLTAVLDCFHSGTLLYLPFIYDSHGRLKPYSYEAVQEKSSEADVISLSACTDNERAYEAREGGTLRGAFIEYMNNSEDRGSCLDVIQSLRGYMHRHRFSQRPQLSSSHQIDINQRFII